MVTASQPWERKRLRELPLQIIDGDRSARYPKRSEFRDSGILFLNTTNIVDDRLDLNDAVYISEEKFAAIKKGRAQRGDIFMTTRGSIGKVARFDCDHETALINAQILILRTDPNQLDSRFLFHTLRSPLFKTHLANFASGSAQPQIPITDLREVDLPIPPLPVQRRIAGILSAYDELMENSQRRIRVLEAMARALYREWFVHFRTPGMESNRRFNSPLGPIPQGWEVKPLESLMSAQIGGGWGKETADEGHIEPAWVIRGTDIPDARCCQVANVPHRFHTVSNLRSRRLQVSDILFEVSGGSKGQPVGRTLLVTPELLSAFGGDAVICASFCKRVCPDTSGYGAELLYLSFLEGYESGEIEQFQVQSTGISNFKWTEYIAQTQRVVPPAPLRKRFSEHVAPMFSQIATLGLQTANLRRTRDLLLPRLLSGQVNLEEN